MPTIDQLVPVGYDRADGLDGRPGVATPSGSVLVQRGGATIDISDLDLDELPNSPSIERAEQMTVSKTYRGAWALVTFYQQFLYRGVVVMDSGETTFGEPFYYLVLSCDVEHEEGGSGILRVVMECKSTDSPPDDFSFTPVELGINILKHPRYFYAFFGNGYGSTTEQQNQMVIRLLQDYFDNTSANYRDAIIKLLDDSMDDADGAGPQPPTWSRSTETYPDYSEGNPSLVAGTNLAKAAAKEIIMKFWRGEDTPYVVGFEITHTQYLFTMPYYDPGGYLQDPIEEGQIPDYFVSTVWPPDPEYNFLDFVTTLNPQCYSTDGTSGGDLNISWLRKADQIEYQRTWFRRTRTWIGSAIGYWDTDFYNQNNRPSTVADYREIKVG